MAWLRSLGDFIYLLMELRFMPSFHVFHGDSEWRQDAIEDELIVVLLPSLHHQLLLRLLPVRLAVAISVVHVLAVGAGMREALEAFAAFEGLLARVQAFVFGLLVESGSY